MPSPLSPGILALASSYFSQAWILTPVPPGRAVSDRLVLVGGPPQCGGLALHGTHKAIAGAVVERVTSGRSEYGLTMDPNPAYIPQVVTWLIARSAWTVSDIQRLRIRGGLYELIKNAVEHGNLEISQREKQEALAEGGYERLLAHRIVQPELRNRRVIIHVLCDTEAERLEYRIVDEGQGFPWRDVLRRSQHDGYSAGVNGRGIFLARSFFPSLAYNDEGNEVTFSVSLG